MELQDIGPDINLDVVTINKFPLPPSANALYSNLGRRRIKSKAYRDYLNEVRLWMLMNQRQLHDARRISMNTTPFNFIHIDCRFYMLRTSIFTKDNKPKRNDTSNRIKALHDALSVILGIDDSYFWSGSFDKLAVDHETQQGVEITMVISRYEEPRK